MIIDELLVGLGFKYNPEDLKKFKDGIDQTRESIKKLTEVVVGAAAAITGFTIVSTRASDEQGKLADELGESVSTIDALQFAMRKAGGSSETMTSTLRSLADQAAAAARGVGSGVEAFGILGVSVTDANGNVKKASNLLFEVSNALKGFSKQQQIELAGKLGIRDSIQLLQQGASGIRKLTDEAKALGVTTKGDAVVSEKFQSSLVDIWQITKQISRVISKDLAPYLTKINDKMTLWWKTNRRFIEQNLPGWISDFEKALKLLVILTSAWLALRFYSFLTSLVTVFRSLTVASILANESLLVIPAIIGGILTAIGLLANDASVFFDGGQSFIGDMIKKYPQWADQITKVAAVFATISHLTEMIFEGWSKIFSLFSKLSLKNLGDFAKNVPGFLADATGLKRTDNTGLIPDIEKFFNPTGFKNDTTNVGNKSSAVSVDKVDIMINGGNNNPKQIADAVLNAFQQTAQNLNSTVDQ